jgi:hypothetical protein
MRHIVITQTTHSTVYASRRAQLHGISSGSYVRPAVETVQEAETCVHDTSNLAIWFPNECWK